jgi:hypothetical protein
MAVLTIPYMGETGGNHTGNHTGNLTGNHTGTLQLQILKACKSFDFLNPKFSIPRYLIIRKGFLNLSKCWKLLKKNSENLSEV